LFAPFIVLVKRQKKRKSKKFEVKKGKEAMKVKFVGFSKS
jgi:hypothetical protein